MPKLLIATHNPAKKSELKAGFAALIQNGIQILSVDDLNITKDPEETGNTFIENARLKAHYFASMSNLPTIADDGGIEILALNGQPGVHSKRWLGRDATDAELIDYTLMKLREVPLDKRAAKFTVCLYYFNPITKKESSITESVNGHIALTPSGKARKGFPYRALFIVDKFNAFYDELTDSQHEVINHRLRAVKNIIPFIKNDLIQ